MNNLETCKKPIINLVLLSASFHPLDNFYPMIESVVSGASPTEALEAFWSKQ